MKTLIVGCHTGGIGDACADGPLDAQSVLYTPNVDLLNVRYRSSIRDYMETFGPFDQMVYSAGVSRLQWVSDLATDEQDLYDLAQDINTRGVALLAANHVTLFPEYPVRYAVVVSDAAHTPMRGSLSYCVSKAGAEMAVRVLARELAPLWTVVGVSPGVVDGTGMTNQLAKDIPKFRNWTPEAARAYEDSSSVLGRRVTKQEVAETIYFALTGPQALNGSIITINGGK